MDAASSKAEKQFPQWKSDLDWGWSLMFYGVGSKREVGFVSESGLIAVVSGGDLVVVVVLSVQNSLIRVRGLLHTGP